MNIEINDQYGKPISKSKFGKRFKFDSNTSLKVSKTDLFNESSLGKTFSVHKIKNSVITNSLVSQLEIDQIVSMVLFFKSHKNPSTKKAVDLLNTLIIKYNEDVVETKL